MQIKISSKHMHITPAIEQYVEHKVDRLRRYFDRIQMIEVVIDKSRKGYTVEIITDVEHHEPFVATSSDADLYACVDLGLDRASRRLKDHKSRLRDNHHINPTGATTLKRTASGRAAVRRSVRKRTKRTPSKRS
jgi:putative sigma-54 modulation protein